MYVHKAEGREATASANKCWTGIERGRRGGELVTAAQKKKTPLKNEDERLELG